MSEDGPSVHASAVKVGNLAVLIRGPSGSGKSRLAFDLIMTGRSGVVETAVLVGDDRVHLATVGNEIEVRPARMLAGLIEIRGLGIRRCDFVGVRRSVSWSISPLRTPNACHRPRRSKRAFLVLKYRRSRSAATIRRCLWLSQP